MTEKDIKPKAPTKRRAKKKPKPIAKNEVEKPKALVTGDSSVGPTALTQALKIEQQSPIIVTPAKPIGNQPTFTNIIADKVEPIEEQPKGPFITASVIDTPKGQVIHQVIPGVGEYITYANQRNRGIRIGSLEQNGIDPKKTTVKDVVKMLKTG